MGSTDAARRRVQEQARPPDAAAVIAELERVNGRRDAIHRRMERLDGEVSKVTARLDELAAAGDGERYALLADKLADRLSVLVTELMADAAHCEESRRQAEALAPLIAFTPVMFQAAVAEGRRMEAEERDQARRARPPGGRHARGRHLRAIPGVPAAAVRAAAAGVVVAGLSGSIVAVHEESHVAAVAAAPARHAAHRVVPDRAVAVPRFSPSPRPSAAVASASPAPAAAPSLPFPSLPASPPAPVTAAPAPVLAVPRLLDLGGSIFGHLPLSATGTDGVEWTATATDGIRLSSYAGVAVLGQPVTLDVTDPTGGPGWVYISFGTATVPVEVVSDLGGLASL